MRLAGSKWGRRVLITSGVIVATGFSYHVSPVVQASARSVVATLADPGSLLALRSPGARTAAMLRQLKLTKMARPGPHQRVLSAERQRPVPAAPIGPLVALPEEWLAPFLAAPDFLPSPAFPAETPLAAAEGPIEGPWGGGGGGWFPSYPIGGGFIPGLPGGGGEGGQPPPPVVIPVPEPATWIIMALGLFATGWRLRRMRSFRPA